MGKRESRFDETQRRERRFASVMRESDRPGLMANRIIDLEDRVRDLEHEMLRLAAELTEKAVSGAKRKG